MYYVYILKSLKSGWLYIGHTNNLEKRLTKHNKNEVKSTKNRGPFAVVYREKYPTRSIALKREKFLKSGKGRMIRDRLVSK